MPRPSPSLLLLPPPPVPVTPAALSAAYRPTITAVISTLKDLTTSTKLSIILPVPAVHDHLDKPRSVIYSEIQHLLAGLYSLICVVCAKLEVDVESDLPGSVDARVILLDYSGGRASTSITADSNAEAPIADLHSFALARRQWNIIFSVEGEPGQQLLADYTSVANSVGPPLQGHIRSVQGGTNLLANASNHFDSTRGSARAHHIVAVGGTFDHIHAGHKLLLTATALLLQPSRESRRLIVGITGDELLKNKKYAQFLGSWKQRQEDVVEFLLSILQFTDSNSQNSIENESFDSPIPNGKGVRTRLVASNLVIECVEIQDPFGPTITDEHVTALVVSGETRSGGQAVNDKRLEKGWNALDVFEIDVLDAQDKEFGPTTTEDFASKISSSAIRKRMADRSWTSSL